MSLNENESHNQTNGLCVNSHLNQEQCATDGYPNEKLFSSTEIERKASKESASVNDEEKHQNAINSKETSDNDTMNLQEGNPTNEIIHDTDLCKENLSETMADVKNNHNTRESRSKKFYGNKNKYISMSPNRAIYFSNGNHYGAVPYYYYATNSPVEKPTPLMFIPTPANTSVESTPTQMSRSSTSPSSNDQASSNLNVVSCHNLPPRLRHASPNETESTQSTGVSSNTATTTTTTTSSSSAHTSTNSNHTNTRRPRSILPRSYTNYYAQHPPPPLMATPPGVLYTYPPTIHPAAQVGYNLTTPEDFDYYNYAAHCLGIPTSPFIWPSPAQSPLSTTVTSPFPMYPMGELPPNYVVDTAGAIQQVSSYLNPEADEWVPTFHDSDVESVERKISLDNDIDFPPLNGTVNTVSSVPSVIKESSEDNPETTTISNETTSEKTNVEETTVEDANNTVVVVESKSEETVSSASSQDDTTQTSNKLSSPPTSSVKVTSVSYSTVILQTSDNQKTNKTRSTQNSSHHHQVTNNQQTTSTTGKDRLNKQTTPSLHQQQQQQRVSTIPQSTNNRRRQSGKTNGNSRKNMLAIENDALVKPQQVVPIKVTDEWIEVKSKKTKKFDRNVPELPLEPTMSDERTVQNESQPPPPSSTTNGQNNATVSSTSEDDVDEKEQMISDVVMVKSDQKDFNQTIIDEIHARLKQHERLMILMRGCPGSGKSTLAKSLNIGFNGVILSTDDFFTDERTNQYNFDVNKLDDAHRFNQQKASDALKRNISPIIIDNTNTQTWEMKPYIAMGTEAEYSIVLAEPLTPWRYKPRELTKRNCHNLPLKRIKDMLSRFEHDVDVQTIIDRLPKPSQTSRSSSNCEQIKASITNETVDNPIVSKKVYEKLEDSSILDDVRLCVNDMITFLTSQFYQTALSSYTSILTNTTTTTTTTSQSSTPLSVSFHDLSLLSTTSASLPSTPTTTHTRFHRPLTRFSSTTVQDHSYFTDHHLRFSTTLTRCLDPINSIHPSTNLTTQSSIFGRKRRKNKTKSTTTTTTTTNASADSEILINTNNNNNNMDDSDQSTSAMTNQSASNEFSVCLAEECPDFVVIDEQNENDWLGQVHRNFGIQINRVDHFKSNSYNDVKPIFETKTSDLINIIHNELNQPSIKPKLNLTNSFNDISIQCSLDDFNRPVEDSDRILIGHCLTIFSTVESTIHLPTGFNECGIQVDLNESIDDSLNVLIKTYSDRVTIETIQQFFDVCHRNVQWTRTQIDAYLENRTLIVPSLRQLALNALNKWNEQIKLINPTFDTHCLSDLLQDINDEEYVLETPTNSIEFVENNSIQIPWQIFDSLQDLYGNLNEESCFNSNPTGLVLPIDDDLSLSIYRALQRSVMKRSPIDSSIKPVNENQRKKSNKSKMNKPASTNISRWTSPIENRSSNNVHLKNVPSLKQIIEEEQQAAKSKNPKPKYQLDYATEYKFKQLERQYPSLDSDLIYDMFRENEFNYEITLACICSMLDDDISIVTNQKQIQSKLPIHSTISTKTNVEPVLESYEVLRSDALRYAQKRREFYNKAQQANRHGMAGVASFYIHQASEQTRLMKNANRAACERLSNRRLEQFRQTQKLDLHGLHADEALQLFKQVEQDLNEGNRRTTPKSIEIITGYGKGSIYGGGDGKIRPIILNYIQQKNYKYSEPNRGVILLQFGNNRIC